MKWTNFHDAEEYCQRVYPEGTGYKFVDRSMTSTLTFGPGRAL